MGLIPALQTFAPGGVIASAAINANFANIRDTLNAFGVYTDVPRTFTAPLTFAAATIFSGVATFGAGVTLQAGATITGGLNLLGVSGLAVAGPISSQQPIVGAYLVANQPVAANGVRIGMGNWNAGADVTLGPMGLAVTISPNPNANLRFAQIQAGDNTGLRTLSVRMNRLFIGTAETPTFVGAELVRIDGSVSVAGITLTGGNTISGDGSGLLNLQQGSVTGLAAALAGKAGTVHSHTVDQVTNLQLTLNGLQSQIDGRAPTVHTHDASQTTSGRFFRERLPRPDFDGTGANVPIPSPNVGFPVYQVRYIDIGNDEFIPVIKGANV